MYCFFDKKMNTEIINISPGEYFVSTKGMMIHTMLGSSVSVALFDTEKKIGGMNNFVVTVNTGKKKKANTAHAEEMMKTMLRDMHDKGCKNINIQAKIIGGGVFEESENSGVISAETLKFTEEYLKKVKITIKSSNTGGNEARRVYFYPASFKILQKKIKYNETDLAGQMEHYYKRIGKKT